MFDCKALFILSRAPYLSVPRLGVDLVMWVVAVLGARASQSGWAVAAAVAFIGAVPMHDILFHGHEGAHGHIARTRWLNELLTWVTHALFGLSGAGYRAFHLAHHRYTHTECDPEVQLMRSVAREAPGWAWLGMPLLAYLAVNLWPLRRGSSTALRRQVVRDLVAASLFHAALIASLGVTTYATFILLPAGTSLAAVVMLRSVCEHHGMAAGSRWTNTRSMQVGPVLGFLWSNASYHLEHHLFPAVPFHKLPTVRRLLLAAYRHQGCHIERGYLRTGLRLLATTPHFAPAKPALRPARPLVERRGLPFRMKVRLFQDILRCPAARRHLWSIYYTGEAYEALHPQGIYVAHLPPRLGRLLARHLADETRHALVFRTLLAQEAAAPQTVRPEEDIGWYGLTHVVPDVMAKATGSAPFTRVEAMRYMAFLHALELRSTSDLVALIEAAHGLGDTALAHALTSIVKDEHYHAAYTHTAVYRLAASRGAARHVLRRTMRLERQAYTASLRCIMREFRRLGAPPPGDGAMVRWTLMRLLVWIGLAVPALPLFDRIPKRLAA